MMSEAETELPNDFDPAEYLRLNPDVERYGADPVGHWLTFGQHERRIYKEDPEFWSIVGKNFAAEQIDPAQKRLTVYATSFRRPASLRVLVSCMQAQTNQDFYLVLLHDGVWDPVLEDLSLFLPTVPMPVEYRFSRVHHGDWGHSLRQQVIRECNTEWQLHTGDDAYYVPVFFEEVFKELATSNSDMLLFDMVHNYWGHQPLYTYPLTNNVDIGSFVVRSKFTKMVGFPDKRPIGDGTFAEHLVGLGPDILKWSKLSKILYVHN